MRPDEVELPFTLKEKEPEPSEGSTNIQHPPTPISVGELDALLASKKITVVNGTKIIGDVPTDPNDAPLRYCCRCKRLDLTEEKDRNEYADLLAVSATSSTVEILWEERVKESDKIVIYITYMEYLRITEDVVHTETK